MAFSIKIQGTTFTNFNNFKLSLTYNSVASTFGFDVFLDPKNPDHKKLFLPFSYRKCEVFADGVLMLTGVVLNHTFVASPEPSMVSISGYSYPGVLNDCNIPIPLYPLQSDGKSIGEIASHLVAPFGISLVVNANATYSENKPEEREKGFIEKSIDYVANFLDVDKPIEISTATVSDSIAGYLNKICAQKNLILTHNTAGSLVITKYRPTAPIAKLVPGNYLEIELKCNGQAMHSDITVTKQPSLQDDTGGKSSILNPFITPFTTKVSRKNPYVPNYRPLVREQTSNQADDTASAAANILANELRNIQFGIALPSWYIGGTIITPGQVITIEDEDLFLSGPVNVFIESVEFTGTPESQTAAIICVIPEVYSSQTPTNFFT